MLWKCITIKRRSKKISFISPIIYRQSQHFIVNFIFFVWLGIKQLTRQRFLLGRVNRLNFYLFATIVMRNWFWIFVESLLEWLLIMFFGLIPRNLTDDKFLGLNCVATKIVSNFEQKQCHTDIAQEMLTMFTDDPDLLKKFVTSAE